MWAALRAAERALDGLLQNEPFAARWHLGIAIICVVVGTGGCAYHSWASARHRRAARESGRSPCFHPGPRP